MADVAETPKFTVNGADGVKDRGDASGKPVTNGASRAKLDASGQAFMKYHAYFASLLEWENPRASAIAYASVVAFIFAVRYLDVFRWIFKLTWIALGITVAAEGAGKLIMGHGLVSQFRPRKYLTISKQTLDILVGDMHELLNFFVIEAQKILFAEDIVASSFAFLGTFTSYFLSKVVPLWVLALVATTTLFFVPLIYATNQELIDGHLKQASDVINAQTNQLKEVAGKHTAQATELAGQYVGDYTAKAQEMLGGRGTATKRQSKGYKDSDFPAAPKDDIKPEVKAEPVAG